MRRVRLFIGLVAGAAALALGVSTVLAAPTVTPTSNALEFGPGDTVTYSIAGTTPLSWTLTGPAGGDASTTPTSPSATTPANVTITDLSTASGVDDGIWTLEADETPSDPVNRTFRWDATPPTMPTLLAPADNLVTNDRTPFFDWTPSSDSGSGFQNYDILLNGVTAATVSSSSWVPTDLADGTYAWQVRARDEVGNESLTPTRVLTIDASAPPPPTLVQTAGDYTRDTSPTFAWSGEPGATYTWRVSSGGSTISTASTNATTVTVPLPADGLYIFEVSQTDAADNTGNVASTSFTLDATAPAAPTLTSLPASPSTNPNPAFAWSTGEPGATFRWQVLNAQLQAIKSGSTGGTSVTVNALPAGSLRFRLWQVDRAGNASGITETAFIITNPKPPTTRPKTNFIKPKTRNVKKLKPSAGKKVRTRTTTLRWRKPTRDTVLYNVQLFRMNGRKLIKIHTAFPRGIAYKVPPKLLKPNNRYVWQVWAYRGPEKGYQSRPIGISYFDKLKTRVPKKLLSPTGNHVAGKKLVVRWRKAGKTRYYQLQVYRGSKRIVNRRVTKTRSTLAAKLLKPTAASYRIIIRRGIGAPKRKRYVKKAYTGKSFKVVKPTKKK